jgi:hypothetical protein
VKTARRLASLGSPKPSKSTSRVARWAPPGADCEQRHAFGTKREPWVGRAYRPSAAPPPQRRNATTSTPSASFCNGVSAVARVRLAKARCSPSAKACCRGLAPRRAAHRIAQAAYSSPQEGRRRDAAGAAFPGE